MSGRDTSQAAPLDHSRTYREWRIRHLPHILRLRKIISVCDELQPYGEAFADFGCSNGYLTHLLSTRYRLNPVTGFDHNEENLRVATRNYPHIRFRTFDLNKDEPDEQFGFVTCLETLEHVGSPTHALEVLLSATQKGGRLLISVPIEVGVVGIAKYLAKIAMGYSLDELSTDRLTKVKYFASLLKNDVSAYRAANRSSWGTHFGFDYRIVDRYLERRDVDWKAWNSFSTRFFLVRK